MRLYQYVGPSEIASRISGVGGMTVTSMAELADALSRLGMNNNDEQTFIRISMRTSGLVDVGVRRRKPGADRAIGFGLSNRVEFEQSSTCVGLWKSSGSCRLQLPRCNRSFKLSTCF